MLVTLEGAVKVTLVRPENLNAPSPILVTPVPMVAVVRLVQVVNA